LWRYWRRTLPIDVLTEMVSIGTLLAFVIVSAGVWILRRRHPELPRPFRTPMVPVVPVVAIVLSLTMMVSLTQVTWIRLFVWLMIGMVIYFGYSRTHSKVQRSEA
jgi:APA family basic amino acid/polyamine antiporter